MNEVEEAMLNGDCDDCDLDPVACHLKGKCRLYSGEDDIETEV